MGGALTIRPASLDDAGPIAAIYAPYVADSAITFEVDAPSAVDMASRMAQILPHFPYLVAEQDGAVIGYAYATKLYERAAYRWAAETTVYLSRDGRRGQGIGTALYRQLIESLRDQGFLAAVGKITLPNAASVRLHEKLGFRASGVLARIGFKQGRWHDVGIYQLDLADHPAEPAETRPFRSA
jgi:phosphinothricin acetyltransferase